VRFRKTGKPSGISMTSKRPTAEAIHNVQFRTGNHDLAEGAFDFGGRLSDDGRVLYRVTASWRCATLSIP
ncbi:hypothetical protein FCI58_27385, partial [Enterobacter hormaechei]|nr:hypothetical protein [Enterobacter hormaechei]